MRSSLRKGLLLVVTLSIVATFVYLPRLLPSNPAQSIVPSPKDSPDDVIVVESSCDLRQGECAVPVDEKTIAHFQISPQGIPTMKPLLLNLRVEGALLEQAEVTFEGKSMFMGQNRSVLEKAATGSFQGEAIVPACSMDDHMIWQAAVDLGTDTGAFRLLFEFQADP